MVVTLLVIRQSGLYRLAIYFQKVEKSLCHRFQQHFTLHVIFLQSYTDF